MIGCCGEPKRRHGGGFFWPLVIIAVGVVFLLDHLEILDSGYAISTFWPLTLVIAGLSSLLSRHRPGIWFGLILILLGAVFQLQQFGLLPPDIWGLLWPLLVICGGLFLLLRTRRGNSSEVQAVLTDDLDVSSVFAETRRQVTSRQFRGGKISAVFSKVTVDFAAAGLEGDSAAVEASVVFGEIVLIVPPEWQVVTQGSPVAGSIEDRHRAPEDAEGAPTLHVKANPVFAHVEIKN